MVDDDSNLLGLLDPNHNMAIRWTSKPSQKDNKSSFSLFGYLGWVEQLAHCGVRVFMLQFIWELVMPWCWRRAFSAGAAEIRFSSEEVFGHGVGNRSRAPRVSGRLRASSMLRLEQQVLKRWRRKEGNYWFELRVSSHAGERFSE